MMNVFKVGDWVERVRGLQFDSKPGDRGVVIGFDFSPWYKNPWPIIDIEGQRTGHHNPTNLKLITPKTQRFTNHTGQISKLLDQTEQYKADATHGKKVWEPMSITFALDTPEEATKWWMLLNSAVNMGVCINATAASAGTRGAKYRGMQDAISHGSYIESYDQWTSIDTALASHFEEPKQ